MSILDTEQSARYIESLTASVQALEADLAATRDKLRQAQQAALEADAKLASTDEILRVWRETSKADARGREKK